MSRMPGLPLTTLCGRSARWPSRNWAAVELAAARAMEVARAGDWHTGAGAMDGRLQMFAGAAGPERIIAAGSTCQPGGRRCRPVLAKLVSPRGVRAQAPAIGG